MCGLAGFINARASAQEQRAWLAAMIARLHHRGPDEGGVWLEAPAALGHRRLSIIDLKTGRQPMLDQDGRAVIVLNGEIYNFAEIRGRLEAKGHRFRTRSDTEVLLAAYLDEGPACLDRLEGMFALAIWDRQKRLLFAARDRMGKKPFYYTLQDGLFAFASELTALSELPPLKLEVDRSALARYLAYEYVPTPGSIYRGVHKLRPGHYLTFQDGRLTTRPYWELPVPAERTELTTAECAQKFLHLAGQAVKKRLVSDVPLGVFLSGGIDSSGVVALMAEQAAGPIKTFSIGFQEPSYDESAYARLVADRFGTDHHQEVLSALDTASLLPQIVERFDEPISDPSIVPTYLLAQLTRQEVTVALGGDGGDELFAGYEYYPAFQAAGRYLRLPQALRAGLIEPLARLAPASTGYVSPRHVVETFIQATRQPEWLRGQSMVGAMGPETQAQLWAEPDLEALAADNIYAETKSLWESFPAGQPIDRLFYLFARQYLLAYILV
ncbi:MAG: asparagine synthase (glutamine-hydrolyzing), partial [Deltaproteobacteria bacterium]|nr:asparagine synthase (glutamine-hydrolyzing) [Deltaproteobacteria bacterium]